MRVVSGHRVKEDESSLTKKPLGDRKKENTLLPGTLGQAY
jgi:hypothetical protein